MKGISTSPTAVASYPASAARLLGHQEAVEMAQRRLEQDLDRIGEAFHFAEGIETVDGALAEGGGDLLGGTEGVEGHARSVYGGPLWSRVR